MAQIALTDTAQLIGDGTKPLYITATNNFLYGFGATTPDTYHVFYANSSTQPNSVLNLTTAFGKLWAKKQDASATINVSIGL